MVAERPHKRDGEDRHENSSKSLSHNEVGFVWYVDEEKGGAMWCGRSGAECVEWMLM
jgi:hypothetical protein